MLMIFFCFLGLVFFKKGKERVCCILIFFCTEFLFKTKLEMDDSKHDFDTQSIADVFKTFL